MRVPAHEIPLPMLPRDLQWINVAPLRMDKQRGRPLLVEFWDFCRINSLRTLPYVKAWHERYAPHGLRVIGVHTGGWPCSRDPGNVEAAVERLGIEHPVVVDSELQVWDLYGNAGWPARYLWDRRGGLFSMHYGEGAYQETEEETGELLGIDVEPLEPVRPEDEPGTVLPAQTADQRGAYEGPYEAGGVHLVCDGEGEVTVHGRTFEVAACGVLTVVEHERHTVGELVVEPGPGVAVLATCFTPALAPV